MYRMYNLASHKVIESKNATFLDIPVCSTVTPDLQALLDEMEGIDYASTFFIFTFLWDNSTR